MEQVSKEIVWKVNDWCFHDFKLKKIMEVAGDRVVSVSDGFLSTSGARMNGECFPLDLAVLKNSDLVRSEWDKIAAIKNCGVNFPDLKRLFVARWVDMCKASDEQQWHTAFETLANLTQTVTAAVERLKKQVVEGVTLFR